MLCYRKSCDVWSGKESKYRSSLRSHIRIIKAELGLVRARHLGHPLPERLNDQPGLDLADIVVSVPLLGEAAERVLDVGDARPRPLREQRGALVDVVDVELGVEALGCKEKTVLDTPISTEKQ